VVSDRISGRVERMLDQADEAADRGEWAQAADIAQRVLALHPDNEDALALVTLATARSGGPAIEPLDQPATARSVAQPMVTVGRVGDGAASGAPLGERRVVTVLFADAVGFTGMSEDLDEEEVYAVMQRCVAVMSEAVQRHSGMVTQFRGDGLMALFGAPIAIEQAELSAVRAALEMQRDLIGLGEKLEQDLGRRPRFRIGLNTGGVVVGSINDDLTMDFTALGDTVNLAARMESCAEPDTVLMSERTAHAVQDSVDCEPLRAVLVKGKAQPVMATRPLRLRELPDRLAARALHGLSPFIGRDHELNLLYGLLDRARRGRAQGIYVSGEAGIGKSRLLHEFEKNQRQAVAMWAVGRCTPTLAASPFGSITQIVRHLVGGAMGDGSHEATARPVSLGEDGLAEHLPHLRFLLGQEDATTATIDPRERNAALLDAIAAVVASATREGVVVIAIEDAHWADAASCAAIVALLDQLQGQRVLIVVTGRPGYEHAFVEHRRMSRVALDRLARDDVEHFLRSVLGHDAPSEQVAVLEERTDGIPFFIEEFARSLDSETGGLVGVPDTVHELLLARVDRLDGGDREVLQLSSAIGESFDARLLETLVDEPSDLPARLDRLCDADLVARVTSRAGSNFKWRHAITRDVVYSTMLHARRRAVHGEIARALAVDGGDSLGRDEQLGFHYEQAGAWQEAITHLDRSARRASATGSGAAALDLYQRAERAAEQLGAHGSLSELAEARATVAFNSNRLDVAVDEWQLILRLAEDEGDESRAVLALSRLGWVQTMLHDHEEADSCTSVAVLRARGILHPDDLAVALAYRFYFLVVDGQMEEGAAVRSELEALEGVASPEALMQFRAVVPSDDRWRGGRSVISAALDKTESSIGSVGAGGRTLALIRQAWVRVLALGEVGRFEEGIELAQRAVADGERLGERMYRARHLNTIGWLHAELFDVETATSWNERSLAVSTDIHAPDSEIECNARLNLVENQLSLGDLSEVEEHMERVRSIVLDPGPRDWFGHWRFSQRYYFISGRLALTREDPHAALESAAACLRLAQQKSAVKNEIKARRIRMVALAQLEHTEAALGEIALAQRTAHDLGLDPQIWRTHLAVRSASAMLGDASAAAKAAADARASLQRLSLHVHGSRRAAFLSQAETALTR
jgi:class 3 adenylate cyclase/tetratricopeptide (TPR) repeat protein